MKSFKGYEFDALLMPKCEPASQVTIQSKDIQTPITLQVAEVHHVGDNFGADWKTTVRARFLPVEKAA